MSDLLRPQPFGVLLKRILKEYETTESIFGIHKSFFYTPRPDAPYAVADFFGDGRNGQRHVDDEDTVRGDGDSVERCRPEAGRRYFDDVLAGGNAVDAVLAFAVRHGTSVGAGRRDDANGRVGDAGAIGIRDVARHAGAIERERRRCEARQQYEDGEEVGELLHWVFSPIVSAGRAP